MDSDKVDMTVKFPILRTTAHGYSIKDYEESDLMEWSNEDLDICCGMALHMRYVNDKVVNQTKVDNVKLAMLIEDISAEQKRRGQIREAEDAE